MTKTFCGPHCDKELINQTLICNHSTITIIIRLRKSILPVFMFCSKLIFKRRILWNKKKTTVRGCPCILLLHDKIRFACILLLLQLRNYLLLYCIFSMIDHSAKSSGKRPTFWPKNDNFFLIFGLKLLKKTIKHHFKDQNNKDDSNFWSESKVTSLA